VLKSHPSNKRITPDRLPRRRCFRRDLLRALLSLPVDLLLFGGSFSTSFVSIALFS
jgi:hypothetical protein